MYPLTPDLPLSREFRGHFGSIYDFLIGTLNVS